MWEELMEKMLHPQNEKKEKDALHKVNAIEALPLYMQ